MKTLLEFLEENKHLTRFNYFTPQLLEVLRDDLLKTKEFEDVEEFNIIGGSRDGLPTTLFNPETDKFNKTVNVFSISCNFGGIVLNCCPDSISKK